MGKAKDIALKPISARVANELVKRVHYSGKVVQNSQLHIGVYYNGRLEGVMQFGPSLDKRKIQGLVSGTKWHEFVELNRMAFSDALPRNSESRAIAIAMKLLKKHAPQVKWVISFADATQCGDGTIYRASGFVLTGIKMSTELWRLETGEVVHAQSLKMIHFPGQRREFQKEAPDFMQLTNGKVSPALYLKSKGIGWEVLPGFQLRYIYFIDPTYKERLAVPILPFSAIEEAGARMYKGEKLDVRPVSGDNIVTNGVGRFDPDPDALT